MADDKPVDDTSTKPVPESTLECTRVPRKRKQPVKTRRGYGRKNKRRNKNEYKNVFFSILGTNSAGLNSKKESLFSVINRFKPSVITLQETKMCKTGNVKIPGFQVFEKVRLNRKGGGLLTAADEDLNPMMISTGKDENEILTIQVDLGNQKLRIINGYGPQEDDDNQCILGFWQELEAEIINAKDNDCLILIELDANAKVGKEVLSDDPNSMTGNGKIMIDMIERHNLKIANAEEMCKGLITRERVVEKKTEKSIIDYILMCEKMQKYLKEILIDDDIINVLHWQLAYQDTIMNKDDHK